MKLKLPKALLLKRRYQVDESMWIVKFGRPKVRVLIMVGRRAYSVGKSGTAVLAPIGGAGKRALVRGGRKTVLFFQWGRVPAEWELYFVSRMKSLEARGVTLQEILRFNLPLVIGEAPAEVLLRQIGRKARSQPKAFASTVNQMFGHSGKKLVVGLNSLDLEAWLEDRNRVDEPWKSVVDAIQQADAKSGIAVA